MRSRVKSRTTSAALLLAFALVACAGGGADSGTPVGMSTASAQTIDFAYSSLDRRPVSRAAFAGKPTVLAFVTTWDIGSQAQTEYLVKMFETDGDKVNYALISFDERKNRELVEEYARALKVKFPVALADVDTVAGRGPFGAIAVPSVAVLDSLGRLVWAKGGLAKPDEVRAALRASSR